jgi:hypothetical protein
MTCLTVLAPPDVGFGYQRIGCCEVNVGLVWGVSGAGFGLFSSHGKGINGPDSSDSRQPSPTGEGPLWTSSGQQGVGHTAEVADTKN